MSYSNGDMSSIQQLRAEIRDSLMRYYTHYYKDELALPDWDARVTLRLDEERIFAEPMIRKIEDWMRFDFSGKHVLVVGAGTGAESIVLASRGADVYGIEPNDDALSILRMKTKMHNLKSENFLSAIAEQIPFPDNRFDLVYCYTVAEHVKDVARSIDEMIRVCRIGGLVFIQTPEYRFPDERHYKVRLIPFAPRWLQKLYLILRGRPTRFLDSVNFLTRPKLDRIFWERNVITIRAYEPVLHIWSKRSFDYWFSKLFDISNQQYVFLRKMAPRENH